MMPEIDRNGFAFSEGGPNGQEHQTCKHCSQQLGSGVDQ